VPAADQSPTSFSRRTAVRLALTGLTAGGITATALSSNRIASSLRADPTPSPGVTSCSDATATFTSAGGANSDHFYTTKYEEFHDFTTRSKERYRDETMYEAPYLLDTPVHSEYQGLLTRLYRLYNPNLVDHFYTPFADEMAQYLCRGYKDESDLDPMWVFLIPVRAAEPVSPPPGCKQLLHLYNEAESDSFFTTKRDEADNAVAKNGYARRWQGRDEQPYIFTSPALVSGHTAVRWYRTYRYFT
jgi:Repeat of unknown function (DUF5648)